MVVETASPDALCPPLAPTREIVAARLGNVELEGTWRATYVLVHRREGDFVILDLRDPEGASRLQRRLPVSGGACTTLSQVIALVLERFFLRPAAESDGEGAATTGDAGPASTSPAESVFVEPSSDVAASTEPLSRPRSPSPAEASASAVSARKSADPAAFSADLSLWITSAWLSPAARLTRRMSGPYELSLGAGVDLRAHESSAATGSVTTRRLSLSLLGSQRQSWGRLFSSSVALELLMLIEQGRSEGLSQTSSALRVVPGFGLRLGGEFLTSTSVGPFAELTGAWLLGSASRSFEVDHRSVAAPPDWAIGANFGLRAHF